MPALQLTFNLLTAHPWDGGQLATMYEEGCAVEKATPMLQQYRQLKSQYPDAILLFRLGDFYEMFEQDAQMVSRELGLTLTSRQFAKRSDAEVRLPMCGVPYQHVTSYIGKLIDRGHKVALVEQTEDARKVKRLVRREVVRVITPGTVVEDALLRGKNENYLAAIVSAATTAGAAEYGLAVIDLATGEFGVTQIGGPEAANRLWEELHRLRPSEYVLPANLLAEVEFTSRLQAIRQADGRVSTRLSPVPAPPGAAAAIRENSRHAALDAEFARQVLLDHLQVVSLEAFGCEHLPLAQKAAGMALYYLKANQISDLAHLKQLWTYDLSEYMYLDEVTRRNLELTHTLREGHTQGSLFSVLNQTVTAMGARLLRRWLAQPLLDLAQIRKRQQAVAELVQGSSSAPFFRAELRRTLDGLYDMERLVGRIGFGNANARDLMALHQSLERLPAIRKLLAQAQAPRLVELHLALDELQDVSQGIGRAIVDTPPILVREGGLIRPGFCAELDELQQVIKTGRQWLAEFESQERQRTGVKSLRVRYNEVFGFFIEVARSQGNALPPEYERRATISHAERFTVPPLKAREEQILAAEERINDLEYTLFSQIRGDVASQSGRIQATTRILAELDCLGSLAEVAAEQRYTCPQIDDSGIIEIFEGRHPVVERKQPSAGMAASLGSNLPFDIDQDGLDSRRQPEGWLDTLGATHQPFIPNDTYMDGETQRLIILTGPNMSGKSVYVRQVALIVLLAHVGSFVPARQARIGLTDRIFARVGASDDISQGHSTFLVEMSETSHILRHATSRSLVILDEVGRGTSTYDGLSLAWAVAEYLHDQVAARVLFATHYHELTGLEEALEGARNYSMAVREEDGPTGSGTVTFLRRVIPGGTDRSYGIHVARLAGLPATVIARARHLLAGFEQDSRSPAHPGASRREQDDAPETENQQGQAAILPPTTITPARKPADRRALFSEYPILADLLRLDVANLTPVQALVALNDLQYRLRQQAFNPVDDRGDES
ncbi:MAG: DNA mismatch repair protein MutS [Chloroflexi bacterium]|nr:DNA mismatch repair protein MutS [Chloroflexota bacterium]